MMVKMNHFRNAIWAAFRVEFPTQQDLNNIQNEVISRLNIKKGNLKANQSSDGEQNHVMMFQKFVLP